MPRWRIPLLWRLIQHAGNHRLSGQPDQNRMLSQTQFSQVRQELKILIGGLAETEPGIENDPLL